MKRFLKAMLLPYLAFMLVACKQLDQTYKATLGDSMRTATTSIKKYREMITVEELEGRKEEVRQRLDIDQYVEFEPSRYYMEMGGDLGLKEESDLEKRYANENHSYRLSIRDHVWEEEAHATDLRDKKFEDPLFDLLIAHIEQGKIYPRYGIYDIFLKNLSPDQTMDLVNRKLKKVGIKEIDPSLVESVDLDSWVSGNHQPSNIRVTIHKKREGFFGWGSKKDPQTVSIKCVYYMHENNTIPNIEGLNP